MTDFQRAHLIEITKYSKPWQDAWLLENDGVIQRAGSQGNGSSVATSRDYRWNEFHGHVMQFPVRGAYWYFGSAIPWKKQADIFLEIVGSDFHFLICDFETYGNIMSASFVASAMEFMLYLKSKGHKVILYTNLSIYQEWINRYDRVRAGQFGLHISWPIDHIPAILGMVDIYTPATPQYRTDWLIWQYAFGEHDVSGCEKDVFNGTPAELLAWATDGVVEEPPVVIPPIGETMYTGNVIISKVNIREKMDPNSADVGDLYLGNSVTGDQIKNALGYDWLRIVTPVQVAGKFVAVGPTGTRAWIKITGTPEPPVPDPVTVFAEYKLTVYSDKSAKIELL